MQISEFGAAVGDLSQMLAQAILLPFRRKQRVRMLRRRRRAHRLMGGPGVQLRGQLVLAAGPPPDEAVVELIRRAGGRTVKAVVVPASTGLPAAGERYLRQLARFGMQAALCPLSTRARADDPHVARTLADARLVVVGGGSPEVLLAVLPGSAALAALAGVLARGGVVAAFGRAAEAFGQWYARPLDGRRPPAGPAGDGAAFGAPGLGLLPGTMVALGPWAAGRVAQAFAAALSTDVQALLLDQGAAVFIGPGWQGDVVGGTVIAVGGRDPAAGTQAPDAPLGGVLARVAPAGWRLDVAGRRVLPPGAR